MMDKFCQHCKLVPTHNNKAQNTSSGILVPSHSEGVERVSCSIQTRHKHIDLESSLHISTAQVDISMICLLACFKLQTMSKYYFQLDYFIPLTFTMNIDLFTCPSWTLLIIGKITYQGSPKIFFFKLLGILDPKHFLLEQSTVD